jgi:hypothetical protein
MEAIPLRIAYAVFVAASKREAREAQSKTRRSRLEFSLFDIIHRFGGRNPILCIHVVHRCLHSKGTLLRE